MYFLLGLVGHPVSHSLSPPMHKAALAHYGLSGDYKLLDLPPEGLCEGVRGLSREGFTGFNVTVPHKLKVMELIDDLTGEARQLGAINTVKVNSSGQMVGHNTDLGGFMVALTESWPEGGRRDRALVVGAGGAARAAVWGLVHLGWPSIGIVSRRREAAQVLADQLRPAVAQAPLKAVPDLLAMDYPAETGGTLADLVVNCTPVGLREDDDSEWISLLIDRLDSKGLFFDMVYWRGGESTALVRHARALNLAAVDGISMLVHQAALAFNFWTGKAGPVAVMQNALEHHLAAPPL